MAEYPAMPLWTDAYLADTMHLTTHEHGAYLLLLMTMWRAGGALPDDDKKLARYARLGPKQWKKMRPIMMDFFTLESGQLKQPRLTDEYNAVRQRSKAAAGNARTRWRKNKDKLSATAQNPQCKPDASILIPIKEPNGSLPLEGPPQKKTPLESAFDAYCFMAEETALPKPQRLTKTRAVALRNRLKECGGLEGWSEALDLVRSSPFLTGDNDRGWKADLDFILRANKFTKLMEGGYNGPAKDDPSRLNGGKPSRTDRANRFAERQAELIRTARGEESARPNPGFRSSH